ncbi:transcriptional regulator [Labrys neptuniae]
MHATPITGAQIRAGRALLRWTAQKLADASSLGVATIRRADAFDDVPQITSANAAAIRRALEDGGIEFIAEHGRGVGVRLARHRLLQGAQFDHVSDGNEG